MNNSNKSIKSRGFTRPALCLVVGLAAVAMGPSNAFMQTGGATTQVQRLPLHAEISSDNNGGGGGSMAIPPELQQALESKNASRKKFGLAPLSVPQFLELQGQVAELSKQQEAQATQYYQQQEQQMAKQQQRSGGLGNFAKTIFQKSLEDTCYSNFDCESPKVCCDLGFKKMCCSNGMMEVDHQYAYEPVPVDMRE